MGLVLESFALNVYYSTKSLVSRHHRMIQTLDYHVIANCK
jgi:23S rRNA maturation-related 3'-5' exoribonuclease YhaM